MSFLDYTEGDYEGDTDEDDFEYHYGSPTEGDYSGNRSQNNTSNSRSHRHTSNPTNNRTNRNNSNRPRHQIRTRHHSHRSKIQTRANLKHSVSKHGSNATNNAATSNSTVAASNDTYDAPLTIHHDPLTSTTTVTATITQHNSDGLSGATSSSVTSSSNTHSHTHNGNGNNTMNGGSHNHSRSEKSSRHHTNGNNHSSSGSSHSKHSKKGSHNSVGGNGSSNGKNSDTKNNTALHSYIFYCCDYFLHLVVSGFILFWVSYYVFLFVHFYPYATNWIELMGLCHQTSVYHINALCNEVAETVLPIDLAVAETDNVFGWFKYMFSSSGVMGDECGADEYFAPPAAVHMFAHNMHGSNPIPSSEPDNNMIIYTQNGETFTVRESTVTSYESLNELLYYASIHFNKYGQTPSPSTDGVNGLSSFSAKFGSAPFITTPHTHTTSTTPNTNSRYQNTLKDDTYSVVITEKQMRKQFNQERLHCKKLSLRYLTRFSPVKGFHVLCFSHFPLYQQSLVVAYQHGYEKRKIPPIRYRTYLPCTEGDEQFRSAADAATADLFFDTAGKCGFSTSPEKPNPLYFLVTWKGMKDLRLHLQMHLISDVGVWDQYTIYAQDFDAYVSQLADLSKAAAEARKANTTFSETPSKAPASSSRRSEAGSGSSSTNNGGSMTATDRLIQHLEQNRAELELNRKKAEEEKAAAEAQAQAKQQQGTGTAQDKPAKKKFSVNAYYRRNPYSMHYPSGKTVHDLKPFQLRNIVFLFEGGRFMWPGIRVGHEITLPIGPDIVLRTLNMRPLIFEIDSLVAEGEVDYLIESSKPNLHRSQVGLNVDKKVSESRTCSSAWLNAGNDPIVKSIKSRVEHVLQTPKTHMEDMEVINYKKGERFDMHYDAFQHHDASSNESQILLHGGYKNRIATVFYYLSNVDSGGHTVFPRYDGNHDYNDVFGGEIGRTGLEGRWFQNGCYGNGFSIQPRKGRTVLFYNMLPSGDVDPLALHGGCPVIDGVKWAANQWIWNRPFKMQT